MTATARAVFRAGIGSLQDLARQLAVPPAVGSALLDTVPGFVRDGEHFWAVPARSDQGLPVVIRRALTAGPLTVHDLHEGLQVALRYRGGPVPPVNLLSRWLSTQPDYLLEGDTVTLAPGVPSRPTRPDRVLLDVFTSRRDDVQRSELLDALHAAGLKGPGAAHLLRTSPIPRRTGYGRYRRR